MIYFNINIRNPYWWNRFKSIKSWAGSTPFEYKFWEVQIMKSAELFRIEFEWNIRQDHAGINLELGLLGYCATFGIHDSRHWDIETDNWVNYD